MTVGDLPSRRIDSPSPASLLERDCPQTVLGVGHYLADKGILPHNTPERGSRPYLKVLWMIVWNTMKQNHDATSASDVLVRCHRMDSKSNPGENRLLNGSSS
jgi:hypothetical protein